ncbi:LysR family transcriptional regulator [Burkholderia pyrrocinia]|uniref:LysR family transcriptional regulator n=1 Tax=Burkholderia pyrrocinia TaxID=60550 RepID=UPI002AB15B95|nr:LysR family transcriptional regulator [Burkholderia pyrrocinia]
MTKSLKQALPFLNAMVVFEAAARLGSLTAAATELNIAQSAVSRHVANLERHTALALFVRKGNRIVLTDDGARLSVAIRDGLASIRRTVEELTATHRKTLVIGCSYDVAQLWLMPRFEIIRAHAGNRQVRLLTSLNYTDFDAPDVDISVRFGLPKNWPNHLAIRLLAGEWFPVCSPALLEQHPALKSGDPRAFLEAPLLHLTERPEEADSWETWIGTDRELDGPRFSTYLPMIYEAIAGRGVALAWAGFVEPQLRSGQLVRLTNERRTKREAFHLVIRKTHEAPIDELVHAVIETVEELSNDGNYVGT